MNLIKSPNTGRTALTVSVVAKWPFFFFKGIARSFTSSYWSNCYCNVKLLRQLYLVIKGVLNWK